MSVDKVVSADYGVSDERPEEPGPARRIWRLVSVTPDPHAAGKFYAIQELAGEWKNVATLSLPVDGRESPSNVMWVARRTHEPPVTRVIYAALDKYGVMQNLNRDASQGRGK